MENPNPSLEQWSDDDEEEFGKEKNAKLGRPRIGYMIEIWNNLGEKFGGKVLKLGKKQFKLRENLTGAEIWIELERLNYWDYSSKQDVPKYDSSDGNPSPIALRTIQ